MSATGLKSLLARPGAVLAPGVYDGLSALMAEQAGFEALYLSGAAIAYTQLGRPDVGLITATQALDVVEQLHRSKPLRRQGHHRAAAGQQRQH